MKPADGEPSSTSGDGSATPPRRARGKAGPKPAAPAPAPAPTAASVPASAPETANAPEAASPPATPSAAGSASKARRPRKPSTPQARRDSGVTSPQPTAAATAADPGSDLTSAASEPADHAPSEADAPPEVDAPAEVSLAARAASLRAEDRLDDARVLDAEIGAALGRKATHRARTMALADAAETELLAGDLAAAGRLLDEALVVAPGPGVGPDVGRTRAAVHHARLEILLGRVTDGRAAAAAGVTAAEGVGDSATAAAWLGVLGLAELLAGDPSVAAVHFTTARDAALERGDADPSRTRIDADLVEALVAAGRLDEAQAALDGFRARGAAARTPWVIAADARCEALVRTARGEPEVALAALRAAAATIESLPLRLERARCLLAWGVALRAAGRRNAAHAALTTAREAFASVGSPPWEDRAVAELTRLRKRPATAS